MPQPHPARFVVPVLSAALAAAALVAGLGDCSGSGGSSTAVTPTVTPTPTPTPTRAPSPSPSPSHSPVATPTATPTHSPSPTPSASPGAAGSLYVVDTRAGRLLKYSLPATNASTPVAQAAIPGTAAFGVAAEPSFIGTLTRNGQVAIFAAPLTSASTPTVQFTNPEREGALPAFDPSGDLWTTTADDTFDEYKPPFANGMNPSLDTDNIEAGWGIVFDAASNLYITDAGAGHVEVFAPPYTGNPTVFPLPNGAGPTGIAIIGSQLFVADTPHNAIVVFALPVSGSSTPSFSFAANDPLQLAADRSGKLYVCDSSGAAILVFAPPFSAASVPAVTVTHGLTVPTGVAVGP